MKWPNLFYMPKADRQVLLALLVVVLLAIAVIWFTGNEPLPVADVPADSMTADTLWRKPASATPKYYHVDEVRPERFPFDPNTADSTQLLRLGLQPWQVRNIYKYRARGGIYRKKEDFARLYGLTVKQYRELEPYINISDDYAPAASLFAEKPANADTLHYIKKLQAGETLMLNDADTSLLQRVPGIGSYFARRIYEYGQRLGGYVSVNQLDEIDGFPTEAKAFFVVSDPHPRQMPINQLSLNELKRHPYITFSQARAIKEYCRLRGPLTSLDDLRLQRAFTEADLNRLRPYVAF